MKNLDGFQLDHVPAPDEVAGLAARLRQAWGVAPGARLAVEEICAHFGIKVEERSLGGRRGGTQGLLLPERRGFSIEIDPEPRGGWSGVAPAQRHLLRRHRSRFLLCHELAHTLFYRCDRNGPQRLVLDSAAQETFCDELARSLLVPGEAARALPFRPAAIVRLQRHFDVSMEVAIRSAVAAHSQRGAAWLLLRRGESTLVQWTSADRSLTARVLAGLRSLVESAAGSSSGRARSTIPSLRAEALFLPCRCQAIVTSTP